MDQNIEIDGTAVNGRNSRAVDFFAEQINIAWRKGPEAIVEAARWICRAHEELPKDQYDSLIKFSLEMHDSVARKLRRIGDQRALCAHVHKLPGCWSTIYELTKLDEVTQLAALADGRIHPKMQRKDAVALRKPPPGEEQEEGDKKGDDDPKPHALDPVANAVKAVNALVGPELKECLKGISPERQNAFKQHFTGGKSDAARMVEIANIVDAIAGVLDRPDKKQPEKDRAKIDARLARIRELTGHGEKSRGKAPLKASNVNLDWAQAAGNHNSKGEGSHVYQTRSDPLQGSEDRR